MKSGKYLIEKGKAVVFPSTVQHKKKAGTKVISGAGHFLKKKDGTVKVYGKAGSLGGIKAKKSDKPKVERKLK